MATAIRMDDAQPYEAHRMTGSLGAEVSGIDLAADLDDATIDWISDALVRHKVLFFRDQEMTAAQQIALGRRFGPLETHPFSTLLEKTFSSKGVDEEIIVVESTAEAPSRADVWHSDVSWRNDPSLGSILRCVIPPAFGGDTMWADMAAAYEGLDDATRSLLSGLVAVHDWWPFRRSLEKQGVDPAVIDRLNRDFPAAEHPVVRTHPVSGEKLIYVNPAFTTHIKGMGEAESAGLLARLYDLPRQPEVQVRFRWTKGAVAFWDNRSTQHYVVGDFGGQHRRMERVTIGGDAPF